MIAFRIISTIFISLSFISMLVKNFVTFSDDQKLTAFVGWSAYGIIWRTFIIISIWII